jgi:hypothetical protein
MVLGMVLLLATACQGVEPTPTPADEAVSLIRGEPLTLEGLVITLEAVRADGVYTDPRGVQREGPHAVLTVRLHDDPRDDPGDRSEGESIALGEGEGARLEPHTLRVVEIVDDDEVRMRLVP